MQKITDELIEKFLSGHCTEEEAAMVSDWLEQNPDEASLLNEYELTEGITPLPEGYREEMLQAIVEKTKDRGVGIRRSLWQWAAAACIILTIGIGFLVRREGKGKEGQSPIPALAVSWVEKYNGGGRRIMIKLPDSSTVGLLPGAHIRYRKDFGGYGKREIRVMGQADFQVAKNKQQPFIVYGGGLYTTVLGTSFTVQADTISDKVHVRLYEGKVAVTQGDTGMIQAARQYLLSPGQELVFERHSGRIGISDFGKRNDLPLNQQRNLLQHPDSLSNWYMFNNQHLADVFDQLSAIYNVPIEYPKAEMGQKYFIGKLDRRDSLNEILSDIALLNHLTVTRRNGRYIIGKQKP